MVWAAPARVKTANPYLIGCVVKMLKMNALLPNKSRLTTVYNPSRESAI
jgi:hypothetical protein